jgi:hypothetical protein
VVKWSSAQVSGRNLRSESAVPRGRLPGRLPGRVEAHLAGGSRSDGPAEQAMVLRALERGDGRADGSIDGPASLPADGRRDDQIDPPNGRPSHEETGSPHDSRGDPGSGLNPRPWVAFASLRRFGLCFRVVVDTTCRGPISCSDEPTTGHEWEGLYTSKGLMELILLMTGCVSC